MRNPFQTLSAVALLAACSETGPNEPPPTAPVAPAQLKGGAHEYEVRITNLTGAQPLSPGVIATHEKNVEVWAPGSPASEGIRQIAENGEDAPAVAELTGTLGVFDVVGTGLPPVHRVGGPGPSLRSFRITARGNANHLSVAVMLICTNDGFTGVHSVPLPGGFKPEEFLTQGYDAGTESNDQDYTHIVDPCGAIGPVAVAADGQNLRTPTPGGVIRLHPGIQPGVGDLSATDHGWTNPVALITVRRVK
jgi:predicted small lipoprotein YifL